MMKIICYLALLLFTTLSLLLPGKSFGAVGKILIPYVPDERTSFAVDLNVICAEAQKYKIKKKDENSTFTWSELHVPLELARKRLLLSTPNEKDHFDKVNNFDNKSKHIVIKATDAIQNACNAISGSGIFNLTDANIHTLREIWKSSGYLRKLVDAHFMEASNDNKDNKAATVVLVTNPGSVPEQPQPSISNPVAAAPVGSLETRLVQGMADFIESRAKAESALFFQDYLKDSLCSSESTPPQNRIKTEDYFQNLCYVLKDPDQSLSLQGMSVFLRAAAKSDLENISDVALADAIDRSNKTEVAELAAASRVALAVYREGRTNPNPLELIRGLSELESLPCESNNQCSKIISLIRTSAILYRAFEKNGLFDSNTDAPNIEPPRINKVIGGIFEAEKMLSQTPVQFPHLSLKKVKADSFADFVKVSRVISAEVITVKQLVDQSNTTESTGTTDHRIQPVALRVAMLDQLLTGLQQLSITMAQHSDLSEAPPSLSEINNAFSFLRQIEQLGGAYLAEDQSSLLLSTVSLTSQINEKLGNENKLPAVVRTTMPVLAELANAQTSEQVQTVLQAAAAPVGSYRTKALRPMSSITAFVGAAYAQEQFSTTSTGVSNSNSMLGFAPVGMHYSWPAPWKSSEWCRSGGVMISVFDFGPLVGTRSGSNVNTNSNVSFNELFSPGIYGTLSLIGPLNIGVGVSQTPNLLKDSTTGNTLNSWRTQIFVSLDLTLFPF